jgi:hypothetical protein
VIFFCIPPAIEVICLIISMVPIDHFRWNTFAFFFFFLMYTGPCTNPFASIKRGGSELADSAEFMKWNARPTSGGA